MSRPPGPAVLADLSRPLTSAATRLYWALPYRLRRDAFRLLWPRKYRDLKAMRTPDRNGDYQLKSFDDMECIFVHVPKTGGVSVATALFGDYAGTHTSLRRYQIIYSEHEYSRYFRFGFVRNPWSRLLSTWNFLKRGGLYPIDAEWFEDNLSHYDSFEAFVSGWVDRENIYAYRHFVPQYRYVQGTTLEHDLDFLGRFENLEQDFETICRRLGLDPVPPLGQLNTSGRKGGSYRDHYTPGTAEIVAEVYREDIELFGYRF